ncbi:3095_t:CDS:1, partial [Funneliformis geosporum]
DIYRNSSIKSCISVKMGDREKAIACELDFYELYSSCGRNHEGLQFHPRATFINRYYCNKTSGK